MLLTTKVHIDNGFKDFQVLEKLCFHSARMYNVGLYSVRQHFFDTGEYLSYYDNYHECKTNENYSLILTDTGQQILQLVDRYTSKASSLDLDSIPKYGIETSPSFSGKRVNILRKYFNERKWNWTFQDHVRAFVNRPCQRVNPLCQSPSL